MKYLISIPYKIGKSGHIISIISCLGEMWCLKKECDFKETLYCTMCRKWFWEMRRIWGLLNEFIKITLPFAPKRWTWETDSICIWATNWWSDLCFSHKQLPYQTPEELEMVHCSRLLCRLAWEWHLATLKIFIYIAFLEWEMEI